MTALMALAGCGAPGGPGGGQPTTTAPEATSTTVVSPTTTTTTAPSPPTTEVGPTTTTTAPTPPVDTVVRVSDGQWESFSPAVSGDGRFVAFTSWDQPPGDAVNPDVFLWDRSTGTTTLVSEESGGGQPAISGDGRYVAYATGGPQGTPGGLALWDAVTGTTNVLGDGSGGMSSPAISADGRFVTFDSSASNLVPDDTNGQKDVFVWDTVTNTTTRITNGDAASEWPDISAAGQVVTYHSYASNLVPGDANGVADVFVWDAATGATTRITDGDRYSAYPKVSGDSRHVTYSSSATNLTPGDTDDTSDVFVWEATTGATTRLTTGDVAAKALDISDDGHHIAYHAYELVSDSNGFDDLYLWDATSGVSQRLTDGDGQSFDPDISADGTAIAFISSATNLVDGGTDTNGVRDVFLWTRTG